MISSSLLGSEQEILLGLKLDYVYMVNIHTIHIYIGVFLLVLNTTIMIGNDIDATITPAEATLMWTVRKEPVQYLPLLS